ncbi:hypothetical protein [Enterococcus sp. BWR-S5]|uniref:hypothetical protein n=1 Tax=Enterococcus sp. BWR-S5 TaxID=2787714 RepID=UPI0019221103|nr:hypothetical protein [Enterococcus sp. BWR-S5]MBL1227263.1 hypothetical protein [Enterococcus sp. BWR-S5]
METQKVLCIMIEDNGDEQVKVTYENVSSLMLVQDLINDEQALHFTSNSERYEFDIFDIEWFRYVSVDSDMAAYFKSNKTHECAWNAQGKEIEY